MRLLRRLAALLGRALDRLARALRAWAGPSGGGKAEGADPARGGGDPPEHWLRYIRERVPWVFTGRRHFTPRPPRPTKAILRRAPEPEAAPAPGSPAEEKAEHIPARPTPRRAAVIRAGPVTPGRSAAKPEPARTPGARMPAAGGTPTAPAFPGPVARPVELPLRAASVASPRPSGARAAESEPRPNPAPSQPLSLVRGAAANPPVNSVSERSSPERVAFARPPTARTAPVAAEEWWPDLRLDGEDGEDGEVGEVGEVGGVSEVSGDGEDREVRGRGSAGRRDGAGAYELAPRGAAPVSALPAPAAEKEADDAGYWADLPAGDMRGGAWQVHQSTRWLLREQLHLARLLAEQAGSSWSGPPS